MYQHRGEPCEHPVLRGREFVEGIRRWCPHEQKLSPVGDLNRRRQQAATQHRVDVASRIEKTCMFDDLEEVGDGAYDKAEDHARHC